jgi:hypothetical protein
MPRVEFEPTTPVLKRAKTVHALDRAATMIGDNFASPCHSSVCAFLVFLILAKSFAFRLFILTILNELSDPY